MVRSTVLTNLSRKRSFSKKLFKPEEIENSGFVFSVDEKCFENGAFAERSHDHHVISLSEFSSNTNQAWLVIVVFLNFSGVVWTENV